jgi:hypothetical protein
MLRKDWVLTPAEIRSMMEAVTAVVKEVVDEK